MITRIGTAPRAAGLDFEAFQDHWRGGHAELAAQLQGLHGYVQNHAVLDEGRPLLPYAGFDACSELEFESIEAMDLAFASGHYQGAVRADERALIDGSRFRHALMRRRILRALDADAVGSRDAGADAVKLLVFWQLDPGRSLAELEALLTGSGEIDVDAAGALGQEQLILIGGAHDGRPPALCAAVDVLWFGSVEDALTFPRSEEAFRVDWELAGVAHGAARLLAHELVVVAYS